jgi:hypothetical protein
MDELPIWRHTVVPSVELKTYHPDSLPRLEPGSVISVFEFKKCSVLSIAMPIAGYFVFLYQIEPGATRSD